MGWVVLLLSESANLFLLIVFYQKKNVLVSLVIDMIIIFNLTGYKEWNGLLNIYMIASIIFYGMYLLIVV